MFLSNIRACHTYKYYLVCGIHPTIIIKLFCDDTCNKPIYGAATNIAFYDEVDDSYSPCVGIGENEKQALNSCLNEIDRMVNNRSNSKYNQQLFMEINTNYKHTDIKEVNLPYKVCFHNGTNACTFCYRKTSDGIIVLTGTKCIKTNLNDINSVINNYLPELKTTNEITKIDLKKHGFYPTFEILTY